MQGMRVRAAGVILRSTILEAARFRARIFGTNFAVGVVTGILMELQIGTSWARLSDDIVNVIGLTLPMNGMFAFFAESAFLRRFLSGWLRLWRPHPAPIRRP